MAKQYTKDTIRVQVSKNLKLVRTKMEMTQDSVAQLFNPPLSRTAVTQWEVGDTLPDVDRLAVLSKAYGVSIDALVFGDEDGQRGNQLTADAVRIARTWQGLGRRKQALISELMQIVKA